MRLRTLVSLALLALVAPAGAWAQYSTSGTDTTTLGFHQETSFNPHFMFNLGGGVSFPLSDAADRFDVGGGFELGAGYQFQRRFGVQAEYMHTVYNVKGSVLTATGVDGTHRVQAGTVDGVFFVLPESKLGIYLIGGPGLYYRRVTISQLAGVAAVPYCDPWLYYCSTTVAPVSEILGARSSTDFGLNAGLGITLRIPGNLYLYLEGRYHYVFGPEFTSQDGSKSHADGQYIPVMFGLRY